MRDKNGSYLGEGIAVKGFHKYHYAIMSSALDDTQAEE
jgi:hypothetical protein